MLGGLFANHNNHQQDKQHQEQEQGEQQQSEKQQQEQEQHQKQEQGEEQQSETQQQHQQEQHCNQQDSRSSLGLLTASIPGLQHLVFQGCADLNPQHLDQLVMGLMAARGGRRRRGGQGGKDSSSSSSSKISGASTKGKEDSSLCGLSDGGELARLKVMIVGCDVLEKQQEGGGGVDSQQQQQQQQGMEEGAGVMRQDMATSAPAAAAADVYGSGVMGSARTLLECTAADPQHGEQDVVAGGVMVAGSLGRNGHRASGPTVAAASSAAAAGGGGAVSGGNGMEDGAAGEICSLGGAGEYKWQPGVDWRGRDVALYGFVEVTSDLLVEVVPGRS